MLVRKRNSTSSPNKFYGIGPVYMLQILDIKVLGKLYAVLEIQKNSTWGLGWDKVRFKALYFTNTKISFTLPPSL